MRVNYLLSQTHSCVSFNRLQSSLYYRLRFQPDSVSPIKCQKNTTTLPNDTLCRRGRKKSKKRISGTSGFLSGGECGQRPGRVIKSTGHLDRQTRSKIDQLGMTSRQRVVHVFITGLSASRRRSNPLAPDIKVFMMDLRSFWDS